MWATCPSSLCHLSCPIVELLEQDECCPICNSNIIDAYVTSISVMNYEHRSMPFNAFCTKLTPVGVGLGKHAPATRTVSSK
jgi:hypothetical protein